MAKDSFGEMVKSQKELECTSITGGSVLAAGEFAQSVGNSRAEGTTSDFLHWADAESDEKGGFYPQETSTSNPEPNCSQKARDGEISETCSFH
ncbi:hypothetical protein GOBAR_DD27786 [Gossypium barbadense]|nr:hypothetical protein GOBAR_DD27786 [Gossypium barbadense]